MSLDIRIIGKGCFFCNELHKIASELGVTHDSPQRVQGRVLVRSRVKKAIEQEMTSSGSASKAEGEDAQ